MNNDDTNQDDNNDDDNDDDDNDDDDSNDDQALVVHLTRTHLPLDLSPARTTLALSITSVAGHRHFLIKIRFVIVTIILFTIVIIVVLIIPSYGGRFSCCDPDQQCQEGICI